MNVICLEDEAFYSLIEHVLQRVKKTNDTNTKEKKWITAKDAMRILCIKSKTTLQEYRDEEKIRFSQEEGKKLIRYDLESINEYLEKHTKHCF